MKETSITGNNGLSSLNKLFALLIFMVVAFFVFSNSASAEGEDTGLNDVGIETQIDGGVSEEPVLKGTSGSESLSDAISGVGLDSQSAQKAKELTSPYVKTFNTIISVLLLVLFLVGLAMSVLDLAYLTVPFLRRYLAPEPQQSGGGGMGMGMGMGMGGMGGGGQQSSPKKQLVTDSAVRALASSNPQQQSGGGGMDMGGMGMGMGGGGGEQPKPKQVLISYLKLRTVELVLLGVCGILFSTLMFTDIGIKLGGFVSEKIGSFLG